MSPAARTPDETTYSGRFAARLRMLREKAGLSVDDVVENLRSQGYQLGERSYYNWESGRAIPPMNVFPLLAQTLKQKTPRSLLPQS